MLVLISVRFYDAISSKKVLVVVVLLTIFIDNISEKRKVVFSFEIYVSQAHESSTIKL